MQCHVTNELTLHSVTMRALCVLTCLLLPVLTWSESFLDLVKEADAATVQAAIDAGADLEARDTNGGTALMKAAIYNDNAAVVQALIDAGSILAYVKTWWTTEQRENQAEVSARYEQALRRSRP